MTARGFALLAVGGLALAGLGCASGGTVASRPDAATPPAAPVEPAEPVAPAEEPAPAPEPEAEPEPVGAYGPMTVVIGDADADEEERPTLAEAARRARESRAGQEGEPKAVITDETLSRYATGKLTVAAEDEAGEAPAAPDERATAAGDGRGEAYWRDRIRTARLYWRDLVSEIARTEQDAADLRQRFYAEDDGFYRDAQIKPAWDRALDRLGELRDRVAGAREGVETILQEGRQAGALPGWLREGIEYEPRADESETEPGIHEAAEPEVIEPDDDGDRP